MKTKITILITGLFFGYTFAQPIQPRYNYGAELEPVGRIINGAGQDLTAFNNYWNVMQQQSKPAIFMTYTNLKNIQSNWTNKLKKDLLSYGDKFIIPQIGLSMTEDGNPSAHYEDDVAAGLYDAEIQNFIDGLRNLAIPVYLRIGYEFNGVSWNGYLPESYKSAFTRITNMIRNNNLEVATVWCFAMDGVMNYMDYYPGDAEVDWWAIDIFSVNHFTDPNSSRFVDSAHTHQKPVMIGETTPRYVGVLNGQQSWNDWFVPFFNFIHNKPNVKAFCYINWDWSKYPQWQNWGDARLEANSIVGGNFTSEMNSAEYLHSSQENIFRKTFGMPDSIAPSTPQNISLVNSGYPVELSWNPITDPSGLSHYIIYKNGVLADYNINIPYTDYNIWAGETIDYKISVIDRAGNESQLSSPINVYVPNSINKSLNGSFSEGKSFWELSTFNVQANAVFSIDSSSIFTDKYSAQIIVSQSSGTNWHIQLAQPFRIYSNHKYKLQFSAKSSGSKHLGYMLQQTQSPYNIYLSKTVTLTSSAQTFFDSVQINTIDDVSFRFLLGSSELETIWLDDVSITEINMGTTDIDGDLKNPPIGFYLAQNFPNPFNPATTIGFGIMERGNVRMSVINILGEEIKVLLNEEKEAGYHSIDFDASDLPSGVYVCRIQSGDFIDTKKLLLLR